jgi:hypothetical protein
VHHARDSTVSDGSAEASRDASPGLLFRTSTVHGALSGHLLGGHRKLLSGGACGGESRDSLPSHEGEPREQLRRDNASPFARRHDGADRDNNAAPCPRRADGDSRAAAPDCHAPDCRDSGLHGHAGSLGHAVSIREYMAGQYVTLETRHLPALTPSHGPYHGGYYGGYGGGHGGGYGYGGSRRRLLLLRCASAAQLVVAIGSVGAWYMAARLQPRGGMGRGGLSSQR